MKNVFLELIILNESTINLLFWFEFFLQKSKNSLLLLIFGLSRNRAIGASSLWGRVGGILAPQVQKVVVKSKSHHPKETRVVCPNLGILL